MMNANMMIVCCTGACDRMEKHSNGCPLSDTAESVSYLGFEVRRGKVGDYLSYENGRCIAVHRTVADVKKFLDHMFQPPRPEEE